MTPDAFFDVVESELVSSATPGAIHGPSPQAPSRGFTRGTTSSVYSLLQDSTIETFLSAQHRLLVAFRALPGNAFLVSHERPSDWELGDWEAAGEHQWVVPHQVDSSTMLRGILEPGAWRLYAALEAVQVSSLPELFRSPPDDVPGALASLGVTALIDAWYDSTEWRVAIAREKGPE